MFWVSIVGILVAAGSFGVAFVAECRARRAGHKAARAQERAIDAQEQAAEALRKLGAAEGMATTPDGRFSWVATRVEDAKDTWSVRNLGPGTATRVTAVRDRMSAVRVDIIGSTSELPPNASIQVDLTGPWQNVSPHGRETPDLWLQWDEHPDPFSVGLV